MHKTRRLQLQNERKSGLTAGAVGKRVARTAVEAGPAGACCVAQQAVRPLSRAPLRLSKNKLWRYGHRYVTKSERVRTDMTVSSLAAIHKHPQGRLVRQQALSAQAGL